MCVMDGGLPQKKKIRANTWAESNPFTHSFWLATLRLFDHGSLQTLPEITTQKPKQNRRLKLFSLQNFSRASTQRALATGELGPRCIIERYGLSMHMHDVISFMALGSLRVSLIFAMYTHASTHDCASLVPTKVRHPGSATMPSHFALSLNLKMQ